MSNATPFESQLVNFVDLWKSLGGMSAAADGPRYKAQGNSIAVPVLRWLGQRIERELLPVLEWRMKRRKEAV